MNNEPVLVDSGALIALYNAKDPAHQACRSAADMLPVGKAYTCWPVLTEATYLLRKYRRQRDSLLAAVEAGEFDLLPLNVADLPLIQLELTRYGDQGIDLADAALVHLGNREQIEAVFTTDRRHFSVYRLKDGRPFHLLPEEDARL
jgi:predicted nucleic acid-binding protein